MEEEDYQPKSKIRQIILKEQSVKRQSEEMKRQEYFLAGLGLVTKAALSEIQNKKTERKRRTTANPQFSNAAIEAKRISAQETAAKRARRRMMLNNPHLYPSTDSCTSKRKSNITRTFLSQNSAGRPALSVFEGGNGKSRNQESETNFERRRHSMDGEGHNSSSSGHHHQHPGSSSSTHHYQLYLNSKSQLQVRIGPSRPKLSKDCGVCSEACDPCLEVIMYCKSDRILFHATCASDMDQMVKSLTVPCPKCEKCMPIEDELGPEEMNYLIGETGKKKILERRSELRRKRDQLEEELIISKSKLKELQKQMSDLKRKKEEGMEERKKREESIENFRRTLMMIKKVVEPEPESDPVTKLSNHLVMLVSNYVDGGGDNIVIDQVDEDVEEEEEENGIGEEETSAAVSSIQILEEPMTNSED